MDTSDSDRTPRGAGDAPPRKRGPRDVVGLGAALLVVGGVRADESGAGQRASSPLLPALVGGVVVGIVFSAFWRNVVRRQRAAEVRAEQARRQIATTLESITDGFMRLDRDWRVVYANAEAERLNRLPRSETLGKTLWELFPAAVGTKLEAEYRRCVDEQVTVEFENHYEPWDRWYALKGYPTPDGGLTVYIRDITDRKRDEGEIARLAAGSERQRRLFDTALSNSTDYNFIFDLGGRFLYANRALLELWGTTAERAAGKSMAELDYPEDVQANLLRTLRLTAETRRAVRDEVAYTSPTGTAGYFEYILAPVFDECGAVAQVVGSSRNIIDRKRAEEERQRLVSIVENSPDFIGISDLEGRPLFGNRAALELVGLDDLDQVRRSSIPDYFVPEQRAFVTDVVLPALLKEGRWSGELTFRHFKTGAAIPVLYDIFRVDDPATGRPLNFATVTRDITERKRAEEVLRQSEQRLRFVMDAMPQKIFTAKPNGDIDYFNPIWMQFTGLPFEQIGGWGWKQFIHPDDVAGLVRDWQHSLDAGDPFQSEHRFRRADGEYRWHIGRAVPMKDEAGRITMWIGSNTDVHEQKQAAEGLRKLTAELSEADRKKDEFLATLAHELRNPLAPIRNGLQVMKLAKDDGPAVEQARAMMERQLGQMVHLVDDLLDVSRISRGKLELRKERVDLAAVLSDAVETSRHLIESGGHELAVVVPAGAIFVDADPTRLGQVFANLLNNAAKYSERGGRIRLTAESAGVGAGPAGGAVVVSVKDTGVGIPPAMLPKVFQMFTQVDASLEKSQGGLGIGLSLVKGLVEMHGGSVEARSGGLGLGSEFVVRLPAASPTARPGTPAAGAGAAPAARRILVVDDNRDAADSLAMVLAIMGNETRTAHDGLEALDAAAAFRPDVILLDIGMPRLNGYDAAGRLRRMPGVEKAILVALTGWGQEDDRRRSREAGFDHHLVKPVDPRELERLLAEAGRDELRRPPVLPQP